MKTIELIQKLDENKPGDILETSKKYADWLISKGIAKEVAKKNYKSKNEQ